MFFEEFKLKIKENKVKGDAHAPRFIVNYTESKSNSVGSRNISYEILTRLNENNDIFIEVNSSLINIPESQRENEVIEFIKSIKDMNLKYRYRKLPSSKSGNVFSKLVNRASNSDHEVLVHIPKDVWVQDYLKTKLLKNGCRYYLLKKDVDPSNILDDMFNGQLLDEDKNKLFKYIIFDCSNLCQMGIIENGVTLEELQKALI